MCCRTSRRFMGLFCVRRERYLRQQHLAKAYNILQPQLILQTKETKGFPQRGGASLCKLISSRNVAEKWAKWTGVRCSDSTVIPLFALQWPRCIKMPHQSVLKSCLFFFLRAQKNLTASYFTYHNIMNAHVRSGSDLWYQLKTIQKGKLVGDDCNLIFDAILLLDRLSPCLTQFIRSTMLEHSWVLGVQLENLSLWRWKGFPPKRGEGKGYLPKIVLFLGDFRYLEVGQIP